MSSKKRRVSFRLDPDEAAVVAPVEFWDHLQLVYQAYAECAETPSERESWLGAQGRVADWVERTRAKVGESDYDY